MDDYRVKDLMVPLSEYATVSEDATLYEAVAELEKAQEEFNLIDVRQPGEYEARHIPGARLIPIAELDKRLDEIDPSKPTLLY